jgi:hypothetical protein
MYLFSRNAKAAPGKALEAMAAAVEIGQKASAVSGLDITTWNHRFGHPVGSVSWTCRVDSHAEFLAATEKLYADAAYLEMEQAISELIVEGEGDAFLEMVSGVPSDAPAKFYTTTRGTMAAGKIAEAMEFSVGITDYILTSVGRSGGFFSSAYGGWADIAWLIGHDTIEQVDEMRAWQGSDAEYLKRVDAAADLFVVDSGHNGLVERVD